MVFYEDAGMASERLTGLHPMWRDKAADLMREVTWNGNGFSTVTNVRVSDGWPLTGALNFTRSEDGARFRARQIKRSWKVERTK